jgi:hypothetical protein
MEKANLGSKYPKDPRREGAVSAIAVSEEDARKGHNADF